MRSSTPPSTVPCADDPVEARPEVGGEGGGIAGGLHGDEGVGADAVLQGGRGVEGEDAAVVHDRHPPAQLVGLLHVVRREQDRLALGVELAEDLPQGEPALRVEAGGRLVHEQHGGPVHDRPSPP